MARDRRTTFAATPPGGDAPVSRFTLALEDATRRLTRFSAAMGGGGPTRRRSGGDAPSIFGTDVVGKLAKEYYMLSGAVKLLLLPFRALYAVTLGLADRLASAATPGGTAVLGNAFTQLAAVIGAPLVPVLALMAAAVTAAADILWSALSPSLESITTSVKDLVLPAMVLIAQGFVWLAKEAVKTAAALIRLIPTKERAAEIADKTALDALLMAVFGPIPAILRRALKGYGGEDKPLPQNPGESDEDYRKRLIAARKKEAEEGKSPLADELDKVGAGLQKAFDALSKAKGSPGGAFNSAFRDVVSSMRHMMLEQGGGARFIGVGDVWKEAQRAAVQDPFKMKMLTIMDKVVTLMEKQLAAAGSPELLPMPTPVN